MSGFSLRDSEGPYSYKDYPILVDLAARFSSEMSEDMKEDIRAVSVDGNFRFHYQADSFDRGKAEVMTLQEIRELGNNVPGRQEMDAQAIEAIAFGPHGVIKPRKGAPLPFLVPIVVAYRRNPSDGSAIDPALVSGRNRAMTMHMVMDAAGVPSTIADSQPISVVKIVVSGREEMKALILAANNTKGGPRRPSLAELTGVELTSRGIDLTDQESILETYPTRANKGDYPSVFGTLVAASAISDRYPHQDVFKKSKAAFVTLAGVPGNRAILNNIFQADTPLVMKGVEAVVRQYEGIHKAATGSIEPPTVADRVKKELCDVLAPIWGLTPKEFLTREEILRAEKLKQEERLRRLEDQMDTEEGS